ISGTRGSKAEAMAKAIATRRAQADAARATAMQEQGRTATEEADTDLDLVDWYNPPSLEEEAAEEVGEPPQEPGEVILPRRNEGPTCGCCPRPRRRSWPTWSRPVTSRSSSGCCG